MKRRLFYSFIISILCIFITACGVEETYAPVAEINTIEHLPKSGSHRVMRGETLYSIAWRYGLDYRYLAERNHIQAPYSIHSGQIVHLRGPSIIAKRSVPANKKEKLTLTPIVKEDEPHYASAKWYWPTKGRMVRGFSAGNKGIDIAGELGQPVFAASAGKVVYSGNGLRGYGNLIILKHNSIYLSAYAHNRKLFVKEGDSVYRGQKIAEMGRGAGKTMLHFEIRRAGRPVNPFSIFRKTTI